MSDGKIKHVNIPVFIPHLGCPNNCIFCNQRLISGVDEFIPEQAKNTIENVLGYTECSGDETEIAFFGGSFTGINRDLMISLLDLAESYVRAGRVSGIRMSTRPDYIDKEIVEILKRYTVSAVELGIQSFSDNVLKASKRGHDSGRSKDAVNLLVENGFSVVGQMMIGLPLSTPEDEVLCAEKICALGASGARIYPTLVFRGTELEELMNRGGYSPLTVEEAVKRSADVFEVFIRNGVECLRIGLCDSENLHSESSFSAGPNHPAIGELVYSEIYRRAMTEKLKNAGFRNDTVTFAVRRGDISMACGQHSVNRQYLIKKFGLKKVNIKESSEIGRFDVMLVEE